MGDIVDDLQVLVRALCTECDRQLIHHNNLTNSIH